MEGLDDNLLREHVAEVLGDLLFASNLVLNRTQVSKDLEVKMAKFEEHRQDESLCQP